MKNSLTISAVAAALCLAGCSEKEDSPDGVYKTTDTFITSYNAESYGDNEAVVSGAIEGFYLVTGFNTNDACFLIDETYASFEMYTDNELKFIGDYLDPDGKLHMTKENIYLFNHAPWNPEKAPEYDYYQFLPVAASGEGEFEFAIKFYQPQSNEYFITRRYRLKLWMEDAFLRAEIGQAE